MKHNKMIIAFLYVFLLLTSTIPMFIGPTNIVKAPPPTFTLTWTYYGDISSTSYVMGPGYGPIAYDINGDGSMELFLVNNTGSSGSTDWLFCLNGTDGTLLWSRTLLSSIASHCPLLIYDLDNDGNFEILVPGPNALQVFNTEDGSLYWRNTSIKCGEAHILVLDTDNTSYPYIYVANNDGFGISNSHVRKIDGRTGQVLVEVQHYYTCHGGIAAADIYNNGSYLLFISDRNYGTYGKGLRCYDADTLELKWNRIDIMCSSHLPVLYDVDKDGVLEVIISQQRDSNAGLYVLNATTGVNIAGMYQDSISGLQVHEDLAVHNFTGGDTYILTGVSTCHAFNLNTWGIDANLGSAWRPPYYADVAGDTELEIIKSTGVSTIRIYDKNFVNIYNITGYTCYGSVVQDIDGDGINDLVTLSSNGTVRAYKTEGVSSSPLPRTQLQHYNERNTRAGVYLPLPGFQATGGGGGGDPTNDYVNFSGGNGTSLNPYLISNWTHMHNVRSYYTKNFTLMNDLNSSIDGYAAYAGPLADGGDGWEPITSTSPYFSGTFDGNGYTISDLFIDRTANPVGLFGRINTATISNLGILNANISTTAIRASILAGYIEDYTIINNCYATGNISSTSYSIGGLIGEAQYSSISDCYTKVNVTSTYTGGTQAVTGGFIGRGLIGSTITRCYSSGNVTSAENHTGGFMGVCDQTVVNNSYSQCNIYRSAGEDATYYGGFVGYMYSSGSTANITKCYSNGSITYIGDVNPTNRGFCGRVSVGAVIDSGNFYDNQTSGQTTTVGNAVGKNTVDMETISTFTGESWDISEFTDFNPLSPTEWYCFTDHDYPRLQNQLYIYDSNDNTYPATGTGLTTAIESLLDGVEIWLPKSNFSVYYVEEELAVMNNSITIHGSGEDTIIEFQNNVSLTFALHADSASETTRFSAGLNDIRIHNLTIVGAGNLEMVLGNDTSVENITIQYITRERPGAFRFVLPPEQTVRNLTVKDCNTDHTFWHGFVINAPSTNNNTTIENIVFRGCSATWAGYDHGNCSVTNGNWSVGFDFCENYGGVNMTIQNVTISNCTAEYCWESGFHMETTPTKVNVTLNNCTSNYNGQKYNTWPTQTPNYKSGYLMSGDTTLYDCNASYNYNVGFYCSGSPAPVLVDFEGVGNLNGLTNGGCECGLLGNGTAGNPYIITTPDELNAVRNNLTAYYLLGNNINLTAFCSLGGTGYNAGQGWNPIDEFRGELNGSGYVITGLYINRPTESVGLFEDIATGGRIFDVGITDANITGGNEFVGSLAARNYNGYIDRCYSTGTITGNGTSVGGLIGYHLGGYINDSYSTATVNGIAGSQRVGGLLGMNYQGRVQYCFSNGAVVTGAAFTGGLVGLTNTGGNYLDTSNFWDTQTSGQAASMMGTGKTTLQMKLIATFAAWDITLSFTVLNDGYPYLSWQAGGTSHIWFLGSGAAPDIVETSNMRANWTTSTSIMLNWTNGTGTTQVKIVRKTGSYPASHTDGTEIYNGTVEGVNDTTVTVGVRYFYKSFSYIGSYLSDGECFILASTDNATSYGASWLEFKGYLTTDHSVEAHFDYSSNPTFTSTTWNETIEGPSYTTGYDSTLHAAKLLNGTLRNIGQSFKTSTTGYYIYNVSIYATRNGNPGFITVSIWEANTSGANYGLPSGTANTSGSTNANLWTGWGWKNITLTPYLLKPNTKYCVVVSTPSGNVVNYAVWGTDQTTPTYSDGCAMISVGTYYTNSTRDCLFEIWGKDPDTIANFLMTSNTTITTTQAYTITQSDLQAGQLYYYRGYANDSQGNLTRGNIRYSLTRPEPPTFISLVPNFGNSSVNISWIAGTGGNRTVLVYNTTGYPSTIAGGTVAYNGTGTYDIVPGIAFNTSYYFSLFSFTVWGSLSRYSTPVYIPWGGLSFNCYNETSGLPIHYNVLISDRAGNHVYYGPNLYGSQFVNTSEIPLGDHIGFFVTNTSSVNWSCNPRMYYYDLTPNVFYNLSFYLPPTLTPPIENDSYYYLINVINEAGQSLDNVYIQIKTYVATVDEFVNVTTGYTDGNGQFTAYLKPNTLYKINCSKDGYNDALTDYIPSPSVYTFTIKMYGETITPSSHYYHEEITFNGYVNRTTHILYVNYTDTLGLTTDCQIYVYEYNYSADTYTLYDTDSTTGDSDFQSTFTGINNSNTYTIFLHHNHTEFGYNTQSFTIPATVGWGALTKLTTMTYTNRLWAANYGANPFGWSNTIMAVLLVLFLFYGGREELPLIYAAIGTIFLFINGAIGFYSFETAFAATMIPALFIVAGILTGWYRYRG